MPLSERVIEEVTPGEPGDVFDRVSCNHHKDRPYLHAARQRGELIGQSRSYPPVL
jgi:hypothetical protein